MKIPKAERVAGHDYTIEYSKDLLRDDGCLGQVIWQQMLMKLEENQSPSSLSVSFWHENLHLVNKHYNSGRLCEEDVDRLAEGLHQVFSDMGITFER